MEEKAEKWYSLLSKMASTRFGSAVIGFLLAAALAYFVMKEGQRKSIESYRGELTDCILVIKAKNDENDFLRKRLSEAKEIAREEAKEEAQQYIDFAFTIVNNARNKIPLDKSEVEQEIKLLEKRKEAIK